MNHLVEAPGADTSGKPVSDDVDARRTNARNRLAEEAVEGIVERERLIGKFRSFRQLDIRGLGRERFNNPVRYGPCSMLGLVCSGLYSGLVVAGTQEEETPGN